MARNPLRFLSEAGYMPAIRSQIITAATLRAGLGPYHQAIAGELREEIVASAKTVKP